ncbi:hypothetical protein LAZ67_19002239 [Cordylochernes scorpioides]|uniref:CCHC-type domain-containing protein n=1 Tax=Cordylochernes scorpioides TaxID=51811 RepID=A0ABY6LII0_9ARAC|nr:hypothetical protein LAZ67_19002239 [Cordylochernes scorpioides]
MLMLAMSDHRMRSQRKVTPEATTTMEKSKKLRTLLRSSVTKGIKEIGAEFDKEYPSRDSILVMFKLLEIDESQLRNANSQIRELMLDDERTTMQELEKEQDLVKQYERNFLLTEKKVTDSLNPRGNDQQGQGDVASIRSSPEKSISCKLLKIALKVFDGTSLEWLGWWSQFEAIHENPSLSEVDKFHYLIQAMKVGTRAERLVKSYPLTEANYPKVIEALKDRFGDKVILTEVYVRQLLKLVINNVRKQNISLESLYDQVESHIRSLDSLGVNVQRNSSFLYPLVEFSLPEELIRVWQRSDMAGYAKDEKELIPSVDQRLTSLLAFVRREVKGEQRIAYLKDGFGDSSRKRDTGHYVTGSHMAKIRENDVKRVPWCIICQGNHWIQSCPKWRSMSVPARVEALKKAHACFKCLRVGHIGKTCRRAIRCAQCQSGHNRFLHRTNTMSQEDQDPNKLKMTGPKDPPASIDKQEAEFTGMHTRTAIPRALLATALIRIVNPNGNGVIVRALLDQGSQSYFVQRDLLQHLSVPSRGVNAQVYGINNTKGELVKELASFTLESLTEPGWTLPMKALVVGSMTGLLPTKDLCLALPSSWKVLPLADPHFEKSGKVDVILGADVYGRLLLPDLKLCDRTHICAQNTRLGWVISGELTKKDQTSPHLMYSTRVKYEDHHPDGLPQRFGEIKEIPSMPTESEEDEFCGNLYKRRKNAPCRVAYGQSGGDTSWEGRPGAGCFGADIDWSAPQTLDVFVFPVWKIFLPFDQDFATNHNHHYHPTKQFDRESTGFDSESTAFPHTANKRCVTGILHIVCVRISREVASADEEAARKYPEKLAKIIKAGGYCAHQIFNADETGLFWKKMPTRTYIAKSEKNASGFKAAKDRVTLLLCSNASGDRMLKPLLVNRSLKPRALKGKDLNTLPVHWMANKKAWVTTAIFTEWFNKCFVPEVENYMKEMGLEFKILLILDNAPGHPNLEHPNIKEIGGEGFDDFGEHDIEELLVDEALNDDDILESMVDTTKDFETVDSELEDVTPLDEKLLREGLQLSGKLEFFFIQNDNDVERALKFQRDLKFCMSGYRELYKELVKPSQRLITDYLVKEKKITEVPKEALPCRSDDVILSSSDESDLAPIHKRVRTLSDSE